MKKVRRALFTLLISSVLVFGTAQYLSAGLGCTIQCLGENGSCQEGPEVCGLLFEICVEICEDDI